MRPTTHTTGPRALRSARSESGFSLIELLIAMSLTAVGVAATLGVFGASGRTTLVAQQGQVGAHQAQAELDRLAKQLSYGELAMTSLPVASTDPKNPNYRVSGTNFQVRSDLTEPLIPSGEAGAGETAKVDPGPLDLQRGGWRIHDHGQALPLRHLARRELPRHDLRRDQEHEARDGRGHRGPVGDNGAAQPVVVLHRDHRPERSPGRVHGHGVRRRRLGRRRTRVPRSSTSTTRRAAPEPPAVIPRAATTTRATRRSSRRRRRTTPAV